MHYFERIIAMQKEVSKYLERGNKKSSVLEFEFKDLKELFQLRHEIIHKIEPNVKTPFKKIKKLSSATSAFLFLSEWVIMGILLSKYENKENASRTKELRERIERTKKVLVNVDTDLS